MWVSRAQDTHPERAVGREAGRNKSLLFTFSRRVPRVMEMKGKDSPNLFPQYANHVRRHK